MGHYLGNQAQLAATTVSIGTTETELYSGIFEEMEWLGVFVTDAGSNNYTLYAQYSADGTTWFNEVGSALLVTAADEGYLSFEGGFYLRAAGIKATGAENVSVHAVCQYDPDKYDMIPILAETTINVKTTATAMHAGTLSEEECEVVALLVNDNGNSNQVDIYVYLSDDKGTTYYYFNTFRIDTALNRRGAVIVRNQGQRVKVTGIKQTAAEDVKITVVGRRPSRPRRTL
jgi:hypothetical protein